MRGHHWCLSVTTLLCLVTPASAETVTIHLAQQKIGTTLVFPLDPGVVTVAATNAVPGSTYRVAGDQSRILVTPKLEGADADCAKPANFVASLLKDATAETEISKAREGIPASSCTDAQKVAIGAAFDATTTLTIGTYEITETSERRLTLHRDAVQPKNWSVILQGPAPAAPTTSDDSRLRRLLDLTEKQVHANIKKCTFADGCTNEPIVVNSDRQAAVYITGIPKKAATVRVTAGEDFRCQVLEGHERFYDSMPDVLMVPLTLKAYLQNTFWFKKREPVTDGLDFYGIPYDPDGLSDACLGLRSPPEKLAKRQLPTVPLLLKGESDLVDVSIDFEDGTRRSFQIPLRYQLFWLDAGGFFAFARQEEEEVLREAAADGQVKVAGIRKHRDIEPATGIVVNIHPGNYPHFAVQFGIAANQGRAPNYYLGLGARLREIGKRGIATFAAGIAAVESTRFPGLTPSETPIAADSPLLVARTQYGLQPYFSISLGFSFGGVSERPNITSAVTQVSGEAR
jgi:hypothetical protein